MGRHLRYRRVAPVHVVDREQLAHVQQMTASLRQQALVALKARTDSVRPAVAAAREMTHGVQWHRQTEQSDLITGRFSAVEDAALWERLTEVSKAEGYRDPREFVKHLCESGSKSGGWARICSRLPQRHMESVVQRIQSQFCQYPRGKAAWTEVEYIWLVGLVLLYRGKRRTNWKAVGRKLGRCPRHCADRYRYLQQTGILQEITPDILEKVVTGEELRDGITINTSGLGTPVSSLVKRNRAMVIWDEAQIIKLESAVYDATGSRTALRNIPWTAIQKMYFPKIPVFHLAQRHYLTIESVLRLDKIVQVRGVVRYLRVLIKNYQTDHNKDNERLRSDDSIATAASQPPELPKSAADDLQLLDWDAIDWSWCMPWWPSCNMAAFARRTLMAALRVKKDSYWRLLTRRNTWQRVALALYKALDCENYEQSDLLALCNRLILLNRLARFGDVSDVPDVDPELVEFPPDTRIECVREFVRKHRMLGSLNANGPISEQIVDSDTFDRLWRLLGFETVSKEESQALKSRAMTFKPRLKSSLNALNPTQSTTADTNGAADSQKELDLTGQTVLSELSAEDDDEVGLGKSFEVAPLSTSAQQTNVVDHKASPYKRLRTCSTPSDFHPSPVPRPIDSPASTPSSGIALSAPSGFTSSSAATASEPRDLGATQEFVCPLAETYGMTSSRQPSPLLQRVNTSPTSQVLRSPPAPYLWSGGTPPHVTPPLLPRDVIHTAEPWPPPVGRRSPSPPPPLILPAPVRHTPSPASTVSTTRSPTLSDDRNIAKAPPNSINSMLSEKSVYSSSREDVIPWPLNRSPSPPSSITKPVTPSDDGMMLLQMLEI